MKILELLPQKGALGAVHFRSRYEGMPDDYRFHVLVTGDTAYDGQTFAQATLHVQPSVYPWTRWLMLKRALGLAARAIRLARRERVDVITCYDPLTLGLVGVLAKMFSGAKLVIEINGHLRNAKAAEYSGSKPSWLRRACFNLIGSTTLWFADCVKILNREQYDEWKRVLARRTVVQFHDFVPIDNFLPSGKDESYVLCLGHPFYLKGVDTLFEAFTRITQEFPDVRLVVMGHCREPDLADWEDWAAKIGNVEIRKPVPYDKVGKHINACTALVVPSRSEGMGRVFIEAMAAAKPCVGTWVGGIPNVIKDGVSGLLVEPENAEDLADKLRTLLADAGLRARMGEAGRQRVEKVLSGAKYVECYRRMLDVELPGARKGLRFNGYEEGAE